MHAGSVTTWQTAVGQKRGRIEDRCRSKVRFTLRSSAGTLRDSQVKASHRLKRSPISKRCSGRNPSTCKWCVSEIAKEVVEAAVESMVEAWEEDLGDHDGLFAEGSFGNFRYDTLDDFLEPLPFSSGAIASDCSL